MHNTADAVVQACLCCASCFLPNCTQLHSPASSGSLRCKPNENAAASAANKHAGREVAVQLNAIWNAFAASCSCSSSELSTADSATCMTLLPEQLPDQNSRLDSPAARFPFTSDASAYFCSTANCCYTVTLTTAAILQVKPVNNSRDTHQQGNLAHRWHVPLPAFSGMHPHAQPCMLQSPSPLLPLLGAGAQP